MLSLANGAFIIRPPGVVKACPSALDVRVNTEPPELLMLTLALLPRLKLVKAKPAIEWLALAVTVYVLSPPNIGESFSVHAVVAVVPWESLLFQKFPSHE